LRDTSRGAIRHPRFRRARGLSTAALRGQSLVEFGLVLPLLMIFLLGIADFGRVFADGIALEAAARNTAEAAAQEYLQLCSKPGYTNGCDDLSVSDYNGLHALALEVGCREAERLTNLQESGGGCPVIAVCVHDAEVPVGVNDIAVDNGCGSERLVGNVPAGCTAMNDGGTWSATRAGPVDGRPYVEVRMCYLFDPLVPLTEQWWGDVRLQRENNFAVQNY